MDVKLTTDVLNEALSRYPKPEIFNTDQGSQYTAQAHVNILKKHSIKISMDGNGLDKGGHYILPLFFFVDYSIIDILT